jgi:Domain of unknown function (DUF4397)
MEHVMRIKAMFLLAAVCTATLLQVACGGGTDRSKAQVRLVNASSDYKILEFNVDGQVVQGQVGYGGAAGYQNVDPDKSGASSISQPGSATSLLSFSLSVGKGKRYTLLSYGALGALKQQLLDDNAGAPDTNKTLLRVVNAAPDAGALDVYLTGSADALTAAVPVFPPAAFGTPSGWLTVNSGTWQLRITQTNSKTDLRLDLPGLVLASKQIVTLVLTPGQGGVLVNALVLVQEGEISRLDNKQARMRVAAGVTNGGVVSADVANVSLLTNTNSPAVSDYVLVPAGAQSPAVGVNGRALTNTSVSLTAGADYTLVVRGSSLSAAASVIEDDNRLPTDTSRARLRLVNGVADLATPLAMTADLVPLANSVEAGRASAYGTVVPSLTAAIAVTAPGLAKPVASLSTQTFVAGANYSLFVLGASDVASAQLRKDR